MGVQDAAGARVHATFHPGARRPVSSFPDVERKPTICSSSAGVAAANVAAANVAAANVAAAVFFFYRVPGGRATGAAQGGGR